MKDLLRQLRSEADRVASGLRFDDRLLDWADLHGWSESGGGPFLVARQAVLDTVARAVVPGLDARASPTVLPEVAVSAATRRAVEEAPERTAAFNFWGDLYTGLIPQPDRRQIGQFWTPPEVATWMTAWLLGQGALSILDVGCGPGNFLLAGRAQTSEVACHGLDLSPLLLNLAVAAHLDRGWEPPALTVADALARPLPATADACVCNPPYTRHHDIPPDVKDEMQAYFRRHLSLDVSRQGTLALFFLLKLISEMRDGAHAAVIVPMEVVDARYGRAARTALLRHATLEAMIHFAPEMNAFHKVDVGASILLFTKGRRDQPIRHLTLRELPETEHLLDALREEAPRDLPFGRLDVQTPRELAEAPKWFHVAPAEVSPEPAGRTRRLGTLAKVVRGIATGANAFFALSDEEVRSRRLEGHVVRTLQRNREAQGLVFGDAEWEALRDGGRPVWLLYLNAVEVRDPALKSYVADGEAENLHRRSLVGTRRAWYLMEQRDVPPIFFTILTRGNPRFIWNAAGVRPLNMFSCLYPSRAVEEAGLTQALWAVLNSTYCRNRLARVSRTYGGSTLKVEPRELDNLPVPDLLAIPNAYRDALRDLACRLIAQPGDDRGWLQLNELIERAGNEDSSPMHEAAGVQLRLLETEEPYRPTH